MRRGLGGRPGRGGIRERQPMVAGLAVRWSDMVAGFAVRWSVGEESAVPAARRRGVKTSASANSAFASLL